MKKGKEKHRRQGDRQNEVEDLPRPRKGGELPPGHPEYRREQDQNKEGQLHVAVARGQKALAAQPRVGAEEEQTPQEID